MSEFVETISNARLKKYIKKRLKEATVILSFLVLLEHYLSPEPNKKLSKSDINKKFDSQHEQFGVNTFRRDYIMRQSGNPKNAIDQDESEKFFLRAEFLDGMSESELKDLAENIREYYRNKNAEDIAFIETIKQAIATEDSKEQRNFINTQLHESGTGRRGAKFEISSYAILKSYFGSFGFTLNRFSVTYANDGGMDYVGQDAVYQVAVKMDKKKFDEDIVKSPGRKRVIVYKALNQRFDKSLFDDPRVSRTISIEELDGFLLSLAGMKPGYLKDILQTMLEEFKREIFQES